MRWPWQRRPVRDPRLMAEFRKRAEAIGAVGGLSERLLAEHLYDEFKRLGYDGYDALERSLCREAVARDERRRL